MRNHLTYCDYEYNRMQKPHSVTHGFWYHFAFAGNCNHGNSNPDGEYPKEQNGLVVEFDFFPDNRSMVFKLPADVDVARWYRFLICHRASDWEPMVRLEVF